VNKGAEFEKLFNILVLYRYYVFSVVKAVYSRDGGKLSQREIQYTFGEDKILGGQATNVSYKPWGRS
jgi:hypothetical protein